MARRQLKMVWIQRYCSPSFECLPPVTLASWLQPTTVTKRKQASPSESRASHGSSEPYHFWDLGSDRPY